MTHLRNIRFKLIRGTAAEWAEKNPILQAGEPAYETNTRRQKIGDGVTPWNELDYTPPDPTIQAMIDASIAAAGGITGPEDDGTSFLLLYENAKV